MVQRANTALARGTRLAGFLLLAWMCAPAGATPKDDKPAAVTTDYEWQIHEQGKLTATESLKVVVSPTKTYFASGSVVPVEKGAVRIITHIQRDPDGQLRKYRRVLDKRLGKGVFAFRRDTRLRIVGVHDRSEATMLADASRYPLWDKRAWQSLFHWKARFPFDGESVSIRFVDMELRSLGRASAKRLAPQVVRSAKGRETLVTPWVIDGLGKGPLTLLLDGGRALVAVTRGERTMLRKGWKLGPAPAPPPDEEPDTPILAAPEVEAPPSPASEVESAPEPKPASEVESAPEPKPATSPEAPGEP